MIPALTKTKLHPLDIQGAFVRRTDLSEAILTRANLSGADATNAIFRGADFQDAILKRTILRGADLRDAKNLTAAQLVHAIVDEDTLMSDDLRRELAKLQAGASA